MCNDKVIFHSMGGAVLMRCGWRGGAGKCRERGRIRLIGGFVCSCKSASNGTFVALPATVANVGREAGPWGEEHFHGHVREAESGKRAPQICRVTPGDRPRMSVRMFVFTDRVAL